MVTPVRTRRPLGTPQQQATTAAAPRRAQRAPLDTPQRNGQRVINTSTHQGWATLAENSRTEALPDRITDGTKVEVGHGKTLNMENFNGVRIDIRVTLPCTVDTVQETIQEASDHVIEAFAREEEYLVGTFFPTGQRKANRRG